MYVYIYMYIYMYVYSTQKATPPQTAAASSQHSSSVPVWSSSHWGRIAVVCLSHLSLHIAKARAMTQTISTAQPTLNHDIISLNP